jgi:hypothetical protein
VRGCEDHENGYRAQAVEESEASVGLGARPLPQIIEEIGDGVAGEGQKVEGGKHRGMIMLAVAEIVFEVVAFGLERVEGLVLDLPASPVGERPWKASRVPFSGCEFRADSKTILNVRRLTRTLRSCPHNTITHQEGVGHKQETSSPRPYSAPIRMPMYASICGEIRSGASIDQDQSKVSSGLPSGKPLPNPIITAPKRIGPARFQARETRHEDRLCADADLHDDYFGVGRRFR